MFKSKSKTSASAGDSPNSSHAASPVTVGPAGAPVLSGNRQELAKMVISGKVNTPVAHALSSTLHSASASSLLSASCQGMPLSVSAAGSGVSTPDNCSEIVNVEGITELTLTDRKARARQPSYVNTNLPRMEFEDGSNTDDEDSECVDLVVQRRRSSKKSSAGLSASGSAEQAGHSPEGSIVGALPTHFRKTSSELPTTGTETSAERDAFSRSRSRSFTDTSSIGKNFRSKQKKEKTLAYWKLEKELRQAKDNLKAKMEECTNLEQYGNSLTQELDDLTLTLFEEVTNEKNARALADRKVKETEEQMKVLQAELAALKMVISHAQISVKGKTAKERASQLRAEKEAADAKPVIEPVLYKEFSAWLQAPTMGQDSLFMKRVIEEDIRSCMAFDPSTAELSATVLKSIWDNTFTIEATHDSHSGPCALSLSKEACRFRLRPRESDGWLYICALTRSRIVAVCDFVVLARHITQKVLKLSASDAYNRFIKLRLNMNKARLGMAVEP
eukprot:m.113411 g.113411  ORF g.113411 m.113411 type:complete len:503 (+) comp16000_c0_seq2:534-2042(+)